MTNAGSLGREWSGLGQALIIRRNIADKGKRFIYSSAKVTGCKGYNFPAGDSMRNKREMDFSVIFAAPGRLRSGHQGF